LLAAVVDDFVNSALVDSDSDSEVARGDGFVQIPIPAKQPVMTALNKSPERTLERTVDFAED
jgi:hypothetical protein